MGVAATGRADDCSRGSLIDLSGSTLSTLKSSSPDNTVAWLTFFGALFVATIAAVTAELRLRRQLKSEETRQIVALTAEADRQTERLEHERKLSDLAEVR